VDDIPVRGRQDTEGDVSRARRPIPPPPTRLPPPPV